MEKQIITNIAVGVLSAGLGAGVTFLVTKKRLEAHYQAITDQEVASVKESYRLLRKEGPLATVEGAAEHLKNLEEDKAEVDNEIKQFTDGIEELGYKQVTDEDMADNTREGAEPLKVGTRVGRYTITDKPLGKVAEIREDGPYIIREDEYHEGYQGHSQYSYTYYEGDKTLAGEDERAVEDIEKVVGHKSLENFGLGSNDPQIVYVRNPILLEDYEITLDPRTYGVMVLGFDKVEDGSEGVRLQADE